MDKLGKVIIVLSGGLDSSTLAYWANSQGYEIFPISFNYGQIAKKETNHANIIAGKLGRKLKLVDLTALKNIFERSTALVNKNIPMPTRFEPKVIVPFRNGIFLSIAVAYAVSINVKKVIYGAHKSDHQYYPDCRKDFVNAFQKAVFLGTEKEIAVENPFYNLTKANIIQMGKRLDVPYQFTWSCYREEEYHCGVCESCSNRKNAFKLSGITDPTQYIK